MKKIQARRLKVSIQPKTTPDLPRPAPCDIDGQLREAIHLSEQAETVGLLMQTGMDDLQSYHLYILGGLFQRFGRQLGKIVGTVMEWEDQRRRRK